jgi:hypothetical protein
MAISTIITSAEAPYSNISPVPFTIAFSASVNGLVLSELVVTGGSVIRLNDNGAGTTWTALVSPINQGSTISLHVPAAVATGPGPSFETNSASNTLVSQFLSIKPRATITHDLAAVTNSQNLRVTIIFDRAVTGFSINDFSLVNASVYSLTGSGTTYTAVIRPIKTGQVEFWVNADAGTDVYGNTSVKSNIVTLVFDPTSFEEKEDAIYGEITDPNILLDFEIPELSQVAEIQSLTDCSKNIPQRLLQMAQDKAFALLSKNPDIKKLANTVAILQKNVETIKAIVEQVQEFIENPQTLMQAVLETQGLTGVALQQKMQAITDKFGAVTGLNSIIEAAKSTGICGQIDYYADGSFAPRQTLTPTDVMPPQIPGVIAGVQNNTYDSTSKDRYDEFAFQLKEQLEIQSSETQEPDRAQMMSIITTLTMGYHDSISKTTDASQDNELFKKYTDNVSTETANNLGWAQPIKDSFSRRTTTAGLIIQRNTDVIRAFYNRNKPTTVGNLLSVGVTTYSTPDKDFTTFLDLKPEQRPAELTSYWSSKHNISSQEQNLAARGIKTGTLNYSDTTKGGAYGSMVFDKTCASSRVPGGSVIELRKIDGSIYDPAGQNPSGRYTVTDTGNAKLTYNKPDIFTAYPQKFMNSDSVQVFLISQGNQTGKQYKLAQQKYGSAAVT